MASALIYVRQSRHKEYERTVSPEVQEAACRALPPVAACTTVEVFRDLDVSGGSRHRKGYRALVERIRAGGVEVVAFYNTSRIARDNLLSAEFYALMEQHPEIAVALAEGHFDRSPDGELNWTVAQAAATHLRKMTGRKIKGAYAHLNATGAPTGQPPYGYRREGKGGAFVVDESAARVVRRLFEDYATGQHSSRDVAARLNAQGVVKPGSRSRGLGRVPDTVVDILQNVAYVGRTHSVSRARREGQLIEASWPAIVDQDLFDRVQGVLGQNRFAGRGGPRHGSLRSYVFSGLLLCEACGRPTRALSDRSASYYYCRRDVGPEQKCLGAQRGVREARLLPWATQLFQRIDAMRPEEFDQALAEDRPGRQSPDALAQVDRSLERQRKLFSWGHISEAEYQREVGRLRELHDQLRGAVQLRRTVELSGILPAWQTGGPEVRRELLVTLFDRLIVSDGQILEYVPRADRAAEVIALIEQAIPEGTVTAVETEYGWRAKGRSRTSTANGGKGGIPARRWTYRVRFA